MVWAALAIFVVAVLASGIFLALRVLELIRGFRAASASLSDATARVSAGADEVTRKAEALGSSSAPMAEAAARFAASNARLEVLTSALDDVRGTVEPLRLRK